MSGLSRHGDRRTSFGFECYRCYHFMNGLPRVPTLSTSLPLSTTGSTVSHLWVIGGKFSELVQFDGMKGNRYCIGCLGEIECSFVRGISYERLPLYMNHTWVTDVGRGVYWGRLGGGI